MSSDRLSSRALNRATLERQLLLRRAELPVLDAVTHLVGLQAQVPMNPYHALWSRLTKFDPAALGRLLVDRAVVRIVVMRGTIHLITAADCPVLRPLVQPVLDAELARHSEFAPALQDVDLAPVLKFARARFDGEPLTGPELRAALQEKFPDLNPAALAYACRNHLALIQAPRVGVWGTSAQIRLTTVEAWLGCRVERRPSIDDVVVRYLATFGPATPADASAWCRLTGIREVFDRLRPRLRPFRDDRDRELFDLPDAPRPDPDTPAPPRFLPEYDNVLLSHADRSRFGSDEHRAPLFGGQRKVHGTVLVDGHVHATWRRDDDPDRNTALLFVDHVGRLSQRTAAAIAAEGRRFLRFSAPDATHHDVRLTPLP